MTQEAGGLSGCAMTMLLDDGVWERHATWTPGGAPRRREWVRGVDRTGLAWRRKSRWDR